MSEYPIIELGRDEYRQKLVALESIMRVDGAHFGIQKHMIGAPAIVSDKDRAVYVLSQGET